MSRSKDGIPPESFYGGRNTSEEKIETILRKSNSSQNNQQPKFMNQLLGPSTTWKVFQKQQDAIDFCLRRKNGLMPFAFEDVNLRRMFLAAHPKVFWALNRHRFYKNCSSYEIIREHSPCKLYLDIEFEYAHNIDKNGDRMLSNMLDVINFNLKHFFNITCTRNEILDLDSSSDAKFSHHVIYEIENVAFQDNYTVGNFIRKISGELWSAFDISKNTARDSMKLQEVADKYNLLPNDILELFVSDRKGHTKLLIDEGVYTKNRHFRLLGSSKKTKNIPLKISCENKYKPNGESAPLTYFLDSLITYFSWKIERILEFSESEKFKLRKSQKQPGPPREGLEFTVHREIDSFINSLVFPKGKIRRKAFFSENSTIVYDIQDFRYCDNIKREHKSNNIKYVVHLESLAFYQKCYDPDCGDFRSDIKRLPEEICFLFKDDSLFLTDFEKFSKDSVQTVGSTKCEDRFEQSISDEDLEKIASCAETQQP